MQSVKPKLAIYSDGAGNKGSNRYLVRRVEETLNLTCRVESPKGIILPKFNMSWDVPKKSQNRYETLSLGAEEIFSLNI